MNDQICARCGAIVNTKGTRGYFCHDCDDWVPTKTKVQEASRELTTLSLRLDVAYDLNGMTAKDMKQVLEHLVANAICNGMLTGDTPAEADAWDTQITEIGPIAPIVADAQLSDRDLAEVERCRREAYAEEYTAVKATLDEIETGALTHNQERDYTLKEDQTSCWITVDNLSVYVHRTDEGVIADILPRKGEAGDPIASCYAFFTEGSIFCRVCEKEFVEAGSRDGSVGICSDCFDKAEVKEDEDEATEIQ